MKKTLFYFAIASMLLLSCQSDNDHLPVPNERQDIPLSRSELEMTALGNAFAFDFFKTVAANNAEANVFVSPLSASIALSMTANGANGATLDEMKATLGFGDYTLDEMNSYYKKLVSGLLTVDNTTTLGIANSIWIKEGFDVKKPFVDVNKDMYNAEVRELDFTAKQAVDAINQWCADKTNQRITKILEMIPSDARMYLINALYFKGTWKYKFDKSKTTSGDFTTASGQTTKVDMMRQECSASYTEDEGLQIVELPYGNEAFSMVVLLPGETQNMDNVIASIPGNWDTWMEHLDDHLIDLKLPKFKFEYGRELNDDLKKMGMNIPFQPIADFGKISDTELQISKVKQDTFVEVNEEGTEAAAVTVVETVVTSIGPDSQRIPFHVDRPFVYIIKEKSTGAILFMGRMGEIN